MSAGIVWSDYTDDRCSAGLSPRLHRPVLPGEGPSHVHNLMHKTRGHHLLPQIMNVPSSVQVENSWMPYGRGHT
jgi:hypothetical protein